MISTVQSYVYIASEQSRNIKQSWKCCNRIPWHWNKLCISFYLNIFPFFAYNRTMKLSLFFKKKQLKHQINAYSDEHTFSMNSALYDIEKCIAHLHTTTCSNFKWTFQIQDNHKKKYLKSFSLTKHFGWCIFCPSHRASKGT